MPDTSHENAHTFQVEEEKKGGSGCLKGCLIALLVFVVLAVIAGFLIARNWKSLMAGGITVMVDAGVDASNLPDAEKQEVKDEVHRLTDGFKDGSISNEQMERIMNNLIGSPLFQALPVFVVDAAYIEESGLSDEQKQEGRQSLKRFLQGVVEDKIPAEKVDAVLDPIADRKEDGEWQLREKVTDEELAAALAAAKAAADEAEIPAEVPDLDVSEEVRKIIDAGLAGE